MAVRRIVSKESDDSLVRLTAGFMPAGLPSCESAFVNAQELLAIDGFELEVELALLALFTKVAGVGRVLVRFQ
jgi:hypothetical protein